MPGKRITQKQVRIYMSQKQNGKTQEIASARADISESSGRRIEQGKTNPGEKKLRDWRTRKDPFAEVWESEIVPMLEDASSLCPTTLFEYLQDKYPKQFCNGKKRTFQRKVKKWKALYGPGKEVMFGQAQIAGRQGLSDFTELNEIEVLITGKRLSHRLYHFRLAYSGWRYVKIILGGESYSALAEALQEALWLVGGSPLEHRTDSLSAAYKNLSQSDQADLTQRYAQLCIHYGMEATRNNRGESHENGAIESPHAHLKHRIRQGLLMRGNTDFNSIEAYQKWLNGIVLKLNRQRQVLIDEERKHLQPLPTFRTTDYTEKVVKVSTSSTIVLKRVLYSVPSRLIGEQLRLHIFDDRLEAYIGSEKTLTLPRIYPLRGKNSRARRIDYRHIIGWLVRKPQAFRYSILRDDILPNTKYHWIWREVDSKMEARSACKWIVGVLALAAKMDCEAILSGYLKTHILKGVIPSLIALQSHFDPETDHDPQDKNATKSIQHSLNSYDILLPSLSQEIH